MMMLILTKFELKSSLFFMIGENLVRSSEPSFCGFPGINNVGEKRTADGNILLRPMRHLYDVNASIGIDIILFESFVFL